MSTLPEPLEIGPYTVDDFLRFAAAYWDFGIGGHYDRAWAEARGFKAPYGQGYFLWATTLVWLQAWLEGTDRAIGHISIRFNAPIYVGDAFVVRAQETERSSEIAFTWTEQSGEVKALGTCQIGRKG